MSDSEPEVKAPKRKPSEKQLENLRKGFAVIKAKREALAKQKEEVKTKIEKGELPEDTPIPKREMKPRITKAKVLRTPVEAPEPEPVVKPSVPRKKHVSKVSQQLDSFKQEMLAMVQKPVEEKIVEKIVEKPVERVIQKERVVSGSELLNKIFNL